MLRWLPLLLALLLVGCASQEARLKGTWKAEPVKPISSGNLADVQRSSMLGLATQNLQIEFNDQGTFKIGAGIGWGTGRYAWKGDVLELTFDTFAPQRPLQFKMEGDKLVQVTEFESDPKITLKKT